MTPNPAVVRTGRERRANSEVVMARRTLPRGVQEPAQVGNPLRFQPKPIDSERQWSP